MSDYLATHPQAAPFQLVDEGNTIPIINAGSNYTIPANTPFELRASGNDDDGDDNLMYSWEQVDLANAPAGLPLTDNGQNPIFRSFWPSSDPTRTFPRLSDLLNNTLNKGETLPTTSRTLNFRATVRDARGGINSDDVTLTVINTGSAFRVLTPNTAVAWTGGTSQTITWNTAMTNALPIVATNVRILLSTDGGHHFPFDLGTTANDGSHTITVPNINTTQARIKVAAEENVFFDLSDANFTITGDATLAGATITPSGSDTEVIEQGIDDTYTLALNTPPAGEVTIEVSANDGEVLLSLDGISFTSSKTLTLDSTTPQTITIRANDDTDIEGPHQDTMTQTVIASTSPHYPVGMPIDVLPVRILDNEMPPLVGVDYDIAASGDAPDQWTLTQGFPEVRTITLSDLVRDDGKPTSFQLELKILGGGGFGISSLGADNKPAHIPSLEEIDGWWNWSNTMRATLVEPHGGPKLWGLRDGPGSRSHGNLRPTCVHRRRHHCGLRSGPLGPPTSGQ